MTIAGALVDGDVRHQAEHRAAPIGAAPGTIMVQPRSLRTGQAARHGMHFFRKHILDTAIPGLHPCDAFDIDSQALGQPRVLVADFR